MEHFDSACMARIDLGNAVPIESPVDRITPAQSSRRKPRVLIGITSPIATRLLEGQLAFLKDQGFEIALVSSPGPQLELFAKREGVRVIAIPIEREISLWKDLVALVRLCALFRAERPDLIDFGTPKAGLLGSLAGLLCGVPHRIYTVRGLRAETVGGFKGFILRSTERIACAASHRNLCVSSSLRRLMIDKRLLHRGKAVVLGHGSSNGVQTRDFAATASLLSSAEQIRAQLLLCGVQVIGFVGRFTQDKGIPELIEAFDLLLADHPEIRLLLVGDFEDGDPIDPRIAERIRNDRRIVWVQWTENVAPYYHVMNVFCLPTHREGFPNTVLEAQAAGRPVVTTDATGAVDSVEPQVTGLVVPIANGRKLANALDRLVRDPGLGRAMGERGRARAEMYFDRQIVWRRTFQFYCELIDFHPGQANYDTAPTGSARETNNAS